MKKISFASLSLFLFAAFFVTVLAQQKVITIKGSDTMVILVQRWTEIFGGKTKAQFQVTGGGSGTGIAALINGTTDICSSSRPIKPEEITRLKEKNGGSPGVEIRVALDGISLYVHKKNPVGKLTIAQVKDIFTGKITNWKALGGPDKKILLYSRENNSGTYEFFKEHVLSKADFAPSAQNMPGTAAVVNAVSKDQYGIGYGGAAYGGSIKELAIAKEESGEYVMPKEQHILSGKYPISRFLYFYLRKRPEGDLKKFVDWILSAEGQKVVHEVGYFPLPAKKAAKK